MAIDSHMHINSLLVPDYFLSKEEAIQKINNDSNISRVINVGLDISTSKECVEISKNNGKFYNSIGIHPLYINNQNIDDLVNLVSDKTVAIGEIGLDSNRPNFEKQKEYLVMQIMLANELYLPVIIHSDNNKEIINIFKKYVKPRYGCVFHCFKPDLDDLTYLINNGYYISFAGKITYKNAKKSIEVLKNVSLNSFLVETDSPYISPEPIRNEINCSSNLHYIIDKIADIKDVEPSYIENITDNNTKKLFIKMK